MENGLNKLPLNYLHELNNRPLSDFEGYSPAEMQYLLQDPFAPESRLKLNVLMDDDYRSVPVLNLIRHLGGHLKKTGGMKLTNKGYLPVKIVADLYEQGFFKEEYIENGMVKLYRQADSHSIDFTRRLCDIAGITKKRYNKLSLTKKGTKLLDKPHELMLTILTDFAFKFNWAYYDRYYTDGVAQVGFAFTLVLLHRYGDKKRRDTFYAKKYFNAFPEFYYGENAVTEDDNPYDSGLCCYSLRTFDRFLDLFGLVRVERERVDNQERWYTKKKFVTATPFFRRLVSCAPHEVYPVGHRPPGVYPE